MNTHDRLKAERDAVRGAASRIVAGEDDFMGVEWGTAIDALIEKAIALGAEPLVAALEGVLATCCIDDMGIATQRRAEARAALATGDTP